MVTSFLSHGQDDRSTVMFTLGAQRQELGDYSATSFGVGLEINIDDQLNLRYPVFLGYSGPSKKFYMYSGWPQVLGFLWIQELNGASQKLAAPGLLLIIIPESINYYIPLDDRSSLIPYFSPYGFERFSKFSGDERVLTASMNFGVKYRIRSLGESIDWMPHFGLKWVYRKGAGVGVNFGIEIVPRGNRRSRN